MIEKRYLQLIHQEIDGENTPEESAALQEHLTTNREARILFDDLRRLSGSFSQIKPADPPQDLAQSILRLIPEQKHDRVKLLQPEPGSLKVRLVRYAYAFAAGLILGALLAPLVLERMRGSVSLDPSEILGTMVRNDAFRGSASIDSLIEAGPVKGTIHLKRSGAALLVDLEIRSQEGVEASVEFDPNQTRFQAFGQSGSETTQL